MSLSSTKAPPESDTSKRRQMEYVSSRAFRDHKMSHDTVITDSLQTLEEFLVRESSFAGTNDGSKTRLQHPPSLSKHQLHIFT